MFTKYSLQSWNVILVGARPLCLSKVHFHQNVYGNVLKGHQDQDLGNGGHGLCEIPGLLFESLDATLTLTPLAVLAKNLPESAKIQHHAVTLNYWTQLLDLAGIGTPLAPCKVSLSGLYSTESIKIQHHAVTLPPNYWT